jgi:putative glutathione S-transferase
MASAVHMAHIKTHYYTSHPALNHYAIIPAGPLTPWWEQPHDRSAKFPSAKQAWDA